MRIFKNAWFERFARKQKIPDALLVEAVRRAEKGQIDADLGGGVLKQRIARSGAGKSGGYRAIILYRRNRRAFFVYGFPKSERESIENDEEEAFKKAAKFVFDLSDENLVSLIEKGSSRRLSRMAKKYRSEAFAAIHETMEALHDVGAIDKRTMRDFDVACLTPVRPIAPENIRAMRQREHLSQPVFARYLNVSKNLVSDWERGVKKPGGPALRLLTVVEKKGISAIA